MPDAAPDVPPGSSPATEPRTASRPHDRVVGDRALETATGRSRSEGYALLDATGALADAVPGPVTARRRPGLRGR